MLQCGGANNTSSKLLREIFAHEAKCEEAFRKQVRTNGGRSPRGNRTGVLPVITANTDVASLRRVRRPGQAAPSPRRKGDPAYPLPYELPSHGIGFKVDEVKAPQVASPRAAHLAKPSHGKTGPFGRRLVTKEFYDDFSGGGIACLSGNAAQGPPAGIPTPRGRLTGDAV